MHVIANGRNICLTIIVDTAICKLDHFMQAWILESHCLDCISKLKCLCVVLPVCLSMPTFVVNIHYRKH